MVRKMAILAFVALHSAKQNFWYKQIFPLAALGSQSDAVTLPACLKFSLWIIC